MSTPQLSTTLVVSEGARLGRRRGASWTAVGAGALLGTALGWVIYEFKRESDAGRDPSPWSMLPYTLVGASIGFMASSR